VGQLSDPYQQGQDDELGITISGLPGELHDPDDPPTDAPSDAGAPADGEPPVADGTPVEGGAGVAYDLDDWSQIEREAITDRLREAGIPHGWEGTSLQVAAVDEAAVENVLDIVEGEADDAGEPLDAERDQVAYDLSEWDDDHIAILVDEMDAAEISHAWDGDELYVYAEHEQAVDDLFDRVSHPHELAVEDDDGTAGGMLLGDVFVAADRLRNDPDDREGTTALVDLDKALDPEQPPYGLGKPEWAHLCERVAALRVLLEADKLDEEAVIESATDLRTALRPYV